MSKVPDVQLCPECGAFQRRGMLCMKCAKLAASKPIGFEKALDAPIRNSIHIKPIAVATSPRAGMSLGTDYFGIDGPSCAEWVKDSIKQSHEHGIVFMRSPAPQVEHTITVPRSQMREWQNRIDQLRAEVNAHGLKFEAVISNPGPAKAWTPPSADFVMTELQDPDSMLNQGLADTLDTLERERTVATRGFGVWPTLTEQEVDALLAELEEAAFVPCAGPDVGRIDLGEHGSPMRMVQTKKGPSPNDVEDKCFPYLQEDVYIPSCQIVGKGVTDSCKHLIGRLDYCHECEHEHDEPIDLSEESI